MSRNALKRMISDYILIQAEIALSFGIVGSIFAKDVSISFSYFLLPAIIGLLCIIPCIITYVKEDLTVKQIMIQRIVEWIVLEVAFIWIVYKMVGDVPGKLGYVAIFFSILFFDIATYAISYFLEKREADDINKKLAQIRADEEEDDYVQ
ncbi:MAG: hypothetical protein MR531_00915 [Lachnospiraceae bacterium]|nr:hypothetical protein [Lachnospiraceae bacterium]